MIHHAEERIADLKERGYQNAALYDPRRRGRHARDVRAAARRSARSSTACRRIRQISPLVQIWKGIGKPLALFALAAAAIGSFFHYIKVGPNEVPEEVDETEPRTEPRRREREPV